MQSLGCKVEKWPVKGRAESQGKSAECTMDVKMIFGCLLVNNVFHPMKDCVSLTISDDDVIDMEKQDLRSTKTNLYK